MMNFDNAAIPRNTFSVGVQIQEEYADVFGARNVGESARGMDCRQFKSGEVFRTTESARGRVVDI